MSEEMIVLSEGKNRESQSAARAFLIRMWAWYVILLLVVGLAYLGKVALDAIL